MMYEKRSDNICPYQQYYMHQAGTGIGVIYKGTTHQRGHGIGSFLGGLFRSILPLLSNGTRVVAKEALNAGVGLLSDMVQAKPLNESVQERFKKATSNLKRKADDKIDRVMTGSGNKNSRRRLQSLIQSENLKGRTLKRAKRNFKLNYNDIFSTNKNNVVFT